MSCYKIREYYPINPLFQLPKSSNIQQKLSIDQTISNCEYLSTCSNENMDSSNFSETFNPSNESDFEVFQDSLSTSNSNSNKKKKPNVDLKKYKTEMCKNWELFQQCKYGNKCRFAHGKDELLEKNLPNKQKYKTKDCLSFSTTGVCPYGQRCLFQHDESKVKIEIVKEKGLYESLLGFSQGGDHSIFGRKKLQVFTKVSKNITDSERLDEENDNDNEELSYYLKIFARNADLNKICSRQILKSYI